MLRQRGEDRESLVRGHGYWSRECVAPWVVALPSKSDTRAAGLLDDQPTGGGVPGLEAATPRNRRSARARRNKDRATRSRIVRTIATAAVGTSRSSEVKLYVVPSVVGKSGHEQRVVESVAASRHANRCDRSTWRHRRARPRTARL